MERGSKHIEKVLGYLNDAIGTESPSLLVSRNHLIKVVAEITKLRNVLKQLKKEHRKKVTAMQTEIERKQKRILYLESALYLETQKRQDKVGV